jgi:hypothetical protein
MIDHSGNRTAGASEVHPAKWDSNQTFIQRGLAFRIRGNNRCWREDRIRSTDSDDYECAGRPFLDAARTLSNFMHSLRTHRTTVARQDSSDRTDMNVSTRRNILAHHT